MMGLDMYYSNMVDITTGKDYKENDFVFNLVFLKYWITDDLFVLSFQPSQVYNVPDENV